MTDANWRATIRSRFNGRENLSKAEFYRRYYLASGIPESGVLECLDFVEEEYEFPVGLLRPGDKLSKLFAPVRTRNPWRWLTYRAKEGDSQSEIEYGLAKRQRRLGTLGTWHRLETVDDLIRAWCGETPK
jgi:hypothetical protein